MTTWTLSHAEYAATAAKIDKINARAAKRGFTGTFTLTATPTTWSETNSAGIAIERSGVTATLTGTPPSYAGWSFLAAVDTLHTDTGATFVVRTAPGTPENAIERSHLAPGQCQHCHTQRNRRNTYVVRHDQTGETRQVGSTCLKDFLGWTGRPVFYSEDDLRTDLDNAQGTGPADYTTATVIATAWAAVHVDGWRPASAQGASTRATVVSALLGRSSADHATRQALAPHMPAGAELAPQIITTLRDTLGTSDYETNLRAVIEATHLPERLYGLAASAIPAYAKAIGEATTPKPEPTAPSQWIGSIGEKITATGTITTAMTIDGYAYGTTSRLVIIRTATATLKVISAASWAYEADHGETITITGTVKAHDTYRDQQQTVLTRTKRVDTGDQT